MWSPFAIRIQYEPLRTLAFGGISGVYATLGVPMAHPVRILKLVNATDANILISFDGVNDNDFLAMNGFIIYDFCSNRAEPAGKAELALGTQIWIKEAAGAPTTGNVYATVIYAAASNN